MIRHLYHEVDRGESEASITLRFQTAQGYKPNVRAEETRLVADLSVALSEFAERFIAERRQQ